MRGVERRGEERRGKERRGQKRREERTGEYSRGEERWDEVMGGDRFKMEEGVWIKVFILNGSDVVVRALCAHDKDDVRAY